MPTLPFRSAAPAMAAMLMLTLSACDASSATGPDDSDGGPAPTTPAGVAVPAAMVGGWRWGSVSPTTFWNDQTGVYQGSAYGMSDHYEFAANGTYKEYVFIYTQSYGCRTQAWVEMEGKVSFTAAAFTTQIAKGRFKTTNSCAASGNMDRAMTAAEAAERSKTRAYALKTDASGKTYMEILDARYDRAQ